MNRPRSFAPIIAAVLMILPLVLYVGSYLALVEPGPGFIVTMNGKQVYSGPYRKGEEWSDRVFWPLEQIDRRLRPAAWEPRL